MTPRHPRRPSRALVWAPENPWLKVFASLIGAVGAACVAALTDNLVTGTEAIQLISMVLAWLGVGAIPNSPSEAVRPAG